MKSLSRLQSRGAAARRMRKQFVPKSGPPRRTATNKQMSKQGADSLVLNDDDDGVDG